jgi:hypothetical protein
MINITSGVLSLPPKLTMADARKEAEMVLGACLDAVSDSGGCYY